MDLTDDHLEYMNIGRKYWKAEIASFNPTQKFQMKGYTDNLAGSVRNGIGLYLWGDNGVGKSYVSAALCKEVWREYRVSSYSVSSCELKESWITPRPAHLDSEEWMADRAEEIPFLVVDDIGKEHRTQSGFVEATFSDLIRRRNRAGKVTVFTVNFGPPEFSKEYGKSLAQCVKESAHLVHLEGVDVRESIAKRIFNVMSRK